MGEKAADAFADANKKAQAAAAAAAIYIQSKRSKIAFKLCYVDSTRHGKRLKHKEEEREE